VTSNQGWKIKSSGAVVIDGRYRVDFSAPIVGLDSPNGQAFATSDKDAPDKQVFTLVCRNDLAQRHHVVASQFDHPFENVLQPHHSGYVDIDGEIRPYVVLDRPLGGRVLDSLAGGKNIAEPIVTDRILPRLIQALGEFEHRGISHRRIRPENLFYLDEARQYVVLGECFSEPPGFSQPLTFETLERSMASPAGRGEGTIMTDLYALGATVAVLLQGKDPLAGKSAEEILDSKLSLGSFVSLVGSTRVSGPTDKLLRGLLNDDPEVRWNLEDTEGWVWGNARRLNHMPVAVRASRPLKMGAKDVVFDRLVAQELGQMGDVAREFVKTSNLAVWVRNSLNDRERAERIATLISETEAGNEAAENLLVTKICKCLDPQGPIRYQGQSVYRDGFGAVVAIAMGIDDKTAQNWLGDLFRSGFLNSWDATRGEVPGSVNEDADYSQIQKYMESGASGFGLERCLYEINTATPCLSPLIVEAGAVDLAEVMRAIDQAIGKPSEVGELLDRHIAAFVAARSVDAALEIPKLAVPNTDPGERRLVVLSLFGSIQKVSECGPLLKVASWMEARMPPVLDLYKSRTRREQLKNEAKMMSGVGDLTGMSKVLGSSLRRAEDRIEHREAMKEYNGLEDGLQRLKDGGDVGHVDTINLGYRIANILGGGALAVSFWFVLTGGW